MKKILTIATAALLFSGATFAHPGGKEACKKGDKECCKKMGNQCSKKGNENKVTSTTKAPSKKA